jgi:hypothetical protein
LLCHGIRRISPVMTIHPSPLDLSIFRAGLGSGRAEKNSVISGRKNPAHDHPTGRIRPQFSCRAQARPGLGRATRVFYSVKQLKTAFQVGLMPKKIFTGFKISAHARPVRLVGGPGPGLRAGSGRAQNAQLYSPPSSLHLLPYTQPFPQTLTFLFS